MNINELRIGSWIFDAGDEQKCFQVEQICKNNDGFSGYYIVFRNGSFKSSIDSDSIQPIALTPEILEKCGFEKHHADFFIDALMLKQKGNLWEVWLYPTPPPQSAYNATNIIYLHQLQNLYFCLCGEELEVKL